MVESLWPVGLRHGTRRRLSRASTCSCEGARIAGERTVRECHTWRIGDDFSLGLSIFSFKSFSHSPPLASRRATRAIAATPIPAAGVPRAVPLYAFLSSPPSSAARMDDAVSSFAAWPSGRIFSSLEPSGSGVGKYFMDRLLTQCRSFVGVNRSPSKTWPRWPPQPAHIISTLFIPNDVSVCVTTAPLTILSNAGQPQPLSNLAAAE